MSSELSVAIPTPPSPVPSQRDMLASLGALGRPSGLRGSGPAASGSLSTPALTAPPLCGPAAGLVLLIPRLFWILHEEGELGTHAVLMKPAPFSGATGGGTLTDSWEEPRWKVTGPSSA